MHRFVLFFTLLILSGCDNYTAKNYGGNSTLKLDNCQKLVSMSWKDNSIWYLTRPFKEGEAPETYTYQESSNFGVIQGTVTVQEVCSN